MNKQSPQDILKDSNFFQKEIVENLCQLLEIEEFQGNFPINSDLTADDCNGIDDGDFPYEVSYFLIPVNEHQGWQSKEKCNEIMAALKNTLNLDSMELKQHSLTENLSNSNSSLSLLFTYNPNKSSVPSAQNLELVFLQYIQAMAIIRLHKFSININQEEGTILVTPISQSHQYELTPVLQKILNFAMQIQYEAIKIQALLTDGVSFINMHVSLKHMDLSVDAIFVQNILEAEYYGNHSTPDILHFLQLKIYEALFHEYSLQATNYDRQIKIAYINEKFTLLQLQKHKKIELTEISALKLFNSMVNLHNQCNVCLNIHFNQYSFAKSSINRYSKSIIDVIAYCLQNKSKQVNQIEQKLIELMLLGDSAKIIDEFERIGKGIYGTLTNIK